MKSRRAGAEPGAGASTRRLIAGICLALTLAIAGVYAQTFHFGYIFYDDNLYVYQNAHIQSGISLESLRWAWTTFDTANWHPLTWMSYLLDYQLFGLNPGAQHAENVALHALASILLFLALLRMTGRVWRSAVVAGIFALHPLHVESVAWISERKDVLCAALEMLALLFYVNYVKTPSVRRYAYVAAAFVLSLLAKPMAITLPCILLLLDVWPLGRMATNRPSRLFLEKLPLFVLAAASSVMTVVAQARGGALETLAHVSLSLRLENAIVGYARYLLKALWPANLAVFYPLETQAQSVVALSAVVIAGLTALAVFSYRTRPYLFVGWFWFAGMLFLVIGLVQVGLQSIADRYAYVPLVGLSIAAVWLIADGFGGRPLPKRAAAALAMVVLAAQAGVAYGQVGYWRSSEELFSHTLAVTSDNSVIENNLGAELQNQGRLAEAEGHFRRAIAADSYNAEACFNLGLVLVAQGNEAGGIEQFRQALVILPTHVDARLHLGHELLKLKQYAPAIAELSEALRLDPTAADAEADLGVAYAAQEQPAAALPHIERALSLRPQNAEARHNRCVVLLALQRGKEAVTACREALNLIPDSVLTRSSLGRALAAAGDPGAAAQEFERVLQADPNNAGARRELEKLRTARAH